MLSRRYLRENNLRETGWNCKWYLLFGFLNNALFSITCLIVGEVALGWRRGMFDDGKF